MFFSDEKQRRYRRFEDPVFFYLPLCVYITKWLNSKLSLGYTKFVKQIPRRVDIAKLGQREEAEIFMIHARTSKATLLKNLERNHHKTDVPRTKFFV